MKKSLLAMATLAAIGQCAAAGWSRKSADEPRGHQLRALDAGGLLANVDSATLNDNNFMQAFGNAAVAAGKIALTANPTAADVLRICRIPAGTKIDALLVACDDMDSNGSPTFVVGIGYAPVNAADGPAASAAYFAAAGQTFPQTGSSGLVYRNFDSITFEKDVYLTMTVGTAAATFAAGSIRATAIGSARGIK